MRPRTLARKKLKPIINLFDKYGENVSPTGFSYRQNAIARAAYAIENNYESYLVVSALLYDLDELLNIDKKSDFTNTISIGKDKQASEFIKPVFDEWISKPIRLKAIASQYGNNTLRLDGSTTALFEESPWFFSSMALFHLHKKLLTTQFPKSASDGEVLDYEETLLSQTYILCNRDYNYA